VKIHVVVWVVNLCTEVVGYHSHPEDGGSKVL